MDDEFWRDSSMIRHSPHFHELLQCMAAGYVPSKFIYLGEGAKIEDAFQDEDTRGHNAVAIDLETAAVADPRFWNADFLQIADIGPGNGSHTVALLERLLTSSKLVRRYIGVDFSRDMLQLLHERITTRFPNLTVERIEWDIEKHPTETVRSFFSEGPIFLLMLGNTLAGVENPVQTLRNIASSCSKGDYLVLHVNTLGNQSSEDMLRRFDSNLFAPAVLTPLHAAGLDTQHGEIEVRYSIELGGVVAYFRFLQDESVQEDSVSLEFHAGQLIRCFVSRRFQHHQILDMLFSSGWETLTDLCDVSEIHRVYLACRT